MNEADLKEITRQFALRVIKLVRALGKGFEKETIGKQLIRCATSVGANYRAVCRARSKADFVAKLAIVEEEADESCYWMELIIEAGLMKAELVGPLLKEGNELVAIITASRKTASAKRS
ncbi:MAG: four helix bundle protein [Planctomycetota bacterium]|nr:four helix bundle protein [Planctomycetota bacterium]